MPNSPDANRLLLISCSFSEYLSKMAFRTSSLVLRYKASEGTLVP